MRIFYCLMASWIFAVSCNQSELPKDVLAPEKMQAVYWDYLRADIFVKELVSKDSSKNLDSLNILLQQKIFSKHQISKATFYKSYNYYHLHQLLMRDMLDTMLVRQQQLLQQQTEEAQKKLAKDTVALSKPE